MTEQITEGTLESARFAGLAQKVRFTSRRAKRTERTLNRHVDECARLQKRVLWVGIATFSWVVGHSPETTAAIIKIGKVLFP